MQIISLFCSCPSELFMSNSLSLKQSPWTRHWVENQLWHQTSACSSFWWIKIVVWVAPLIKWKQLRKLPIVWLRGWWKSQADGLDGYGSGQHIPDPDSLCWLWKRSLDLQPGQRTWEKKKSYSRTLVKIIQVYILQLLILAPLPVLSLCRMRKKGKERKKNDRWKKCFSHSCFLLPSKNDLSTLQPKRKNGVHKWNMSCQKICYKIAYYSVR